LAATRLLESELPPKGWSGLALDALPTGLDRICAHTFVRLFQMRFGKFAFALARPMSSTALDRMRGLGCLSNSREPADAAQIGDADIAPEVARQSPPPVDPHSGGAGDPA